MGDFLTCNEVARQVGLHRQTINQACLRYPGFGIQTQRNGWWRIPTAHLLRLRRGETVAMIAKSPSLLSAAPKPRRKRHAIRLEAADA
jgi:hypothetical protein